ncbi:UBR-type domain-containing protein [Mycena chlorophos]|uniref:UBR-type domain-containing protein n=1 Tax=Mycena chlorophos TaxID=658473 RepID=A0A8H6TAP4_MYCCL|nr:UBR-type domain-containing protein [Mycena chlorophos]
MTDNSRAPLIWLITGCSSGFGKCLAESAAARGDRVIATARKLESLSHFTNNPNITSRVLDVTAGAAAIRSAVAEAVQIWGKLDVVVNNAGSGFPTLIEEGGTDALRKHMEINFFGAMDFLSATVPYLRAQREGTVVVIGSRSAWKPDLPGINPYGASKAAVHALTEGLTGELAPFGVRVLLVEPGAFRTDVARGAVIQGTSIEDYAEIREKVNARFATLHGSEPGDPVKAMEVVVDIVRGEGCAAGRPFPKRIALGEDCERDIRAKLESQAKMLDEWQDVVRSTGIVYR